MRRRDFIVALTGLTLCPARTHAQQPSRKIADRLANRAGLLMSVDRGKAEVAFRGREDRR
jgi:hypothetical protein